MSYQGARWRFPRTKEHNKFSQGYLMGSPLERSEHMLIVMCSISDELAENKIDNCLPTMINLFKKDFSEKLSKFISLNAN